VPLPISFLSFLDLLPKIGTEMGRKNLKGTVGIIKDGMQNPIALTT